jgi:hypothetical protein
MGWIEGKSVWLFRPSLTDVFVGGEAREGLKPACEVVGHNEVGEVASQAVVAFVVIAASSSIDSTVDFGSFGPVGRSVTELRFFHLATVFWLIP